MIASAFSLSHVDWFVNVEDANHVWSGLNWDSPILVVHDVAKALQFYERVFGFVPVFILPDQSNDVTFARMRYRGTYFTLTTQNVDAHDSCSRFSDEVYTSNFYLYVDNVDQVLISAQENGSRVLEMPHSDLYGDYRARLIDIFGYIWDIAARV